MIAMSDIFPFRFASIGPRIFLRGNRRGGKTHRHPARAASIGPRIFLRGNRHPDSPQFIRGPASIGPRIFLRGNPEIRFPPSSRRDEASIGPRIFLRGNLRILGSSSEEQSLLQLGHGFFSVETRPVLQAGGERMSFNWATDFSPWKPLPAATINDGCSWLQLGHGFFSVETVQPGQALTSIYSASIGPRIFLRGNVNCRCTIVPIVEELQLGHGFFSVETSLRVGAGHRKNQLQLGHGFFSVETSTMSPTA